MIPEIERWFETQYWQPKPYQREAWLAYRNGESGLINVPTGGGKTYSALMGPLAELAQAPNDGLHILYISPLRALGYDISLAIEKPAVFLNPKMTCGLRTGDTAAKERVAQNKKLPHILITTPESLALLLTQKDRQKLVKNLRCVIVDEWHELMRTKRGSLLELNLSYLRQLQPKLQTWGLSATLGNTEEAAQMLLGAKATPTLIQAKMERRVDLKVLLPEDPLQIPATGHYGTRMASTLLADLDLQVPSLIFTNTRAQAERWFALLQQALPADKIGLHHGSLDLAIRREVEAGIKSGSLKAVVATSSLDLGVDYSPIKRVYQIGSPKAVARMIQRAGRGFHSPGTPCEIRYLPTYGLELLEIDAVGAAIAKGEVEEQGHYSQPIDVLTQFLVNCAVGDGFHPDQLFAVVTAAYSFQEMTREEFDWVVDFAGKGGTSLSAYPQYRRFAAEPDGRFVCGDRRIVLDHKMNVGTILSDATIPLRLQRGGQIGTIEERFLAGLKPGDVFQFGGQSLQFVRLTERQGLVAKAPGKAKVTPRWFGSKFAFSPVVTRNIRQVLAEPERFHNAAAILQAQSRHSRLPGPDEVLMEVGEFQSQHGFFCYPMEGEYVNQALAVLLSLRLTRGVTTTFAITANDYGFCLLCDEPFPFAANLPDDVFSLDGLEEDIAAGINLSQFAKQHFREICRIAGLVKQTGPGRKKSMRQMSLSSGLLFDVFVKFDPDNRLLQQAHHEILYHEFDYRRLRQTLEWLQGQKRQLVQLERLSPFALPLAVDSLGSQFSTESLSDRVDRIQQSWFDDELLGVT